MNWVAQNRQSHIIVKKMGLDNPNILRIPTNDEIQQM